MLKILFVTWEYPPRSTTGAGVYALELTRSLATLGIEVHVIAPGKKKETMKQKPNLYIHWQDVKTQPLIAYFSIPGFPWFSMMLSFHRNAHKIIEKRNIDLIHSNDTMGVSVRSNIPMVATIHHPAMYDYRSISSVISKLFIRLFSFNMEKIMMKKCEKLVCTSHLNIDLFKKEYPDAGEKMILIGGGVDTYRFRYIGGSKVRDDYRISNDDILLFHPGGARSERKGTLHLLEALENLKGYKIKCIITGESREAGWGKRINREITRRKLDNIILTGEIPYLELPNYFSSADIVVFPSIFEGYGLVPLEAMACGKPVIATKVGELPYLIRNNKNGVLIDVGDTRALTSMIVKLIEDDKLRRDLGKEGRAFAKKMSWEETARKMIHLYHSVIGEGLEKGFRLDGEK